MKILLVLPSLEGGGAERVAITLMNAWCLQHDVTVLTLLDRPGLFALLDQRVRVVRGEKKWRTPWHQWLILRRLVKEAKRHDVVIAGLEVVATYFAYAAAVLARKPIVAWVHTLLPAYLRLNYPGGVHAVLCRWVYRRIKQHVYVSQGAQSAMRSFLNRPLLDVQMSVIYNPVQLSNESVLDKVPLPGKPFILGVGRLVPEKGFGLLINAFALLRQRNEEVELLILGEGKMRAELEAQIAELGLKQSVHLPGFVDDTTAYYSHAAVFALSSNIEGLSMALIEAMYSGVPIVATDLPSVYELLGDDIIPVALHDVTAFARQLQQALHQQEPTAVRQKRQHTAARFTPGYAVDRWEVVLHRATCSPHQFG